MTPKPKKPGGGGTGGDGTTGKRPSQVSGGVDASKGVSSAHQAIDQHAQAGRAGGSGSGTPVNPSVPGPAGKIQLRLPSDRHQLNRVSPKSPAKAENTIILPEARDAVRQDVADIQAGKARWDPDTNSYVTESGRRYKVESNGTVFPVDGPGFVQLNRPEYKALQALIRFDGDVEAAKASVSRDPGIPPGSFDKASQVYQHYKK
ncbi:hypothetical protein [Actinophytocola sp.]|uniref:hypothetical protein n=1 Tax=Actinophytocola sp. TaxID=1872138 RepID=UPI002ED32B55